jgi:hypothetical protein
MVHWYQSQWPRRLRRGSAAILSLGLWVGILPAAWMSVSCECCVLSSKGLCDGLIARPEESYRVWCVWVWSWSLDNEEALAHWGAVAPLEKKWNTGGKILTKEDRSTWSKTSPSATFSTANPTYTGLELGRLLWEAGEELALRNRRQRRAVREVWELQLRFRYRGGGGDKHTWCCLIATTPDVTWYERSTDSRPFQLHSVQPVQVPTTPCCLYCSVHVTDVWAPSELSSGLHVCAIPTMQYNISNHSGVRFCPLPAFLLLTETKVVSETVSSIVSICKLDGW